MFTAVAGQVRFSVRVVLVVRLSGQVSTAVCTVVFSVTVALNDTFERFWNVRFAVLLMTVPLATPLLTLTVMLIWNVAFAERLPMTNVLFPIVGAGCEPLNTTCGG